MERLFGTTDAAQELGVTGGRIRQMILRGQLRATKLGPVWMIRLCDLDRVRDRRPGRPPKGGRHGTT